jgi:hypothetical protein
MKRVMIMIFLLVAALAGLSGEVTLAYYNPASASNQSSTNSSSIPGSGNGSAQIGQTQNGQSISNSNIEQRKLEIEEEKVQVERQKAWWSAASTIVPLLAALGTLIYSVWSFRKQSEQTAKLQKEAAIETAKLQNESAKLQFEIKAAEIAFSGKTPEAVKNRANVLKTIFGDRLPKNFPPTFDPKTYGGGKESPEEKMFFLELLLKYPGKEAETIKGWEMLFGDTWLDRVKPVILKDTGTPTNKPEEGEEKITKKLNDTSPNSALQQSSTEVSDGNKITEPSIQTSLPQLESTKLPIDQQTEKQTPNDLGDTVK